jgi:integrase/recombinase XerD
MNYDDRFFKYIRNFLMAYLPRNRCYSENTVKAYRDTINLLRVYIEEKESYLLIKYSIIEM